jgi:Do/DeqQ family serine protease
LFISSFTLAHGGEISRRTPVVIAVEKVSPAVVNINTEQRVQEQVNPFFGLSRDPFFERFFQDFFEPRYRERYHQSLGSGVIISPDGYILTNEHVVLQASRIQVTLVDEREFEAELVGADPESDLAVLKIHTTEKLPVVTMGTSHGLLIGETVIAIGNPFGLSHTVTTGVISAIGRSFRARDRVYRDFIQTDASINPGNSGGPLLNINGELIGINTAIYSEAQGIGFAIPIDRAKRIVEELIHYGQVRPVWIGLFVQDLTPQLARALQYQGTEGVVITKIMEGSPAHSGGLQQGDVIVAINQQKIKTKDDYLTLIRGVTTGEKLLYTLSRQGKSLEVSVKVTDFPLTLSAELARDLLGVEVDSITRATERQYNLHTREGALITQVLRGSVAAQIGIRQGDVIRKLNNLEIKGKDDFHKVIPTLLYRDKVLLLIQRGANGYHLSIPLTS